LQLQNGLYPSSDEHAPHEHAQNRHAESLVKYPRQSSNKFITASALHRSFWGYAVLHVNRIRCLMSSALNRSKSRAEIWNGVRTNVHISPALIFSSQVMAHVPLSLQRTHGKASPRAIPAIYIGEAPGVKGGILYLTLRRNVPLSVVRLKSSVFDLVSLSL
jgi:hypothetical protein